jgi:hypothetical protein
MGMASLSKRITQKGGFRMRGRKLLAVLAGVSLLLGGIGVFTALATTLSGNQEADFNFLPVVSTVGPTDPDVTAALTAFSTVLSDLLILMRLATILLVSPSIAKLLLVL